MPVKYKSIDFANDCKISHKDQKDNAAEKLPSIIRIEFKWPLNYKLLLKALLFSE